jgi:hypothetical protein
LTRTPSTAPTTACRHWPTAELRIP